MHTNQPTLPARYALSLVSVLLVTADLTNAQTAPSPANAPGGKDEEEVITLSPFEVSANNDRGYSAATTLAGNRLNTELRDIGSAVQVVTGQFLKDIGATSNETLLQYTTGTEVGNVYGNFAGVGDGAQLNENNATTSGGGSRYANPNQNTRVRGLTAADTTRDYFLTDIPWDSYNIDRVDLSRGPNSILFGQGSPAGIINAGSKPASFKNRNEVEVRFDDHGTKRATLDINYVLLKDELALRLVGLNDDTKYQQKPAFQDDHRLFGALRFEPKFLKRGSARTILRANVEAGDVDSNRPRSLPPGDYISPWFLTGTYTGTYTGAGSLIPGTAGTKTAAAVGDPRVFQNLNKMTTNPHIAQNDNFFRTNFQHGLTRPAINGGDYKGYINPYYNPWIGNFGASIGGPVAYYGQSQIGGTPNYIAQEIRETYGINTSGAIDGSLGFDFNRMVGINPYSTYAKNAGLPYSQFGVYKNYSLTDPSIFDFYNNLIDGPNKKEWQRFNVYNASLSQTFFNDQAGFDLTYNREHYENGQLSLLTDTRQAIYIDINSVYTDGTNTGTGTYPNNIPFQNGTANPNLGRPFISDNGANGNNSYSSDRTSKRITAFLTRDFAKDGQTTNMLLRFLGRHTITGLWSQDEQKTDTRSWMRYAVLDPAYRAFLGSTAKFNEGQTYIPSQVIYLGPSLLTATSAAGANIPRPDAVYTVPSGSLRIFDSHWANRPGVDPAAVWYNDFYPANQAEHTSTQSENPANYVGWTNIPLNITDSEAAPGNRDALSTSARLQRKLTTSKALVWQAHFWDNAIVGTYGIRRDRAQGWSRSMNTDSGKNENGVPQTTQYGQLILTPDVYRLPVKGSDLEETSKSWSAVVHIDDLPGLHRLFEKSPVRVSAFYNDSSNFQPEALRVDIYGQQIALPHGKTKDYGLLFETKDGKYSLKINKYKTSATNANSTGLSGGATSFLGNSQAWGANWANQYQYDFAVGNQPSDQIITKQANNRPAGSPNPPGWTDTFRPGNPTYDPTNSLYNYDLAPGETREQATARENAAVAAWRAWQAKVDPRFYAAWGIDLNAPFDKTNPKGVTASTPNGFALTEDSTSEGYEIELTAQPTRNWRLAINAAQQKATRQNIGGANLAAFIAGYQNAVQNTAAGDLRIWWGGSGNETALFQWYNNVGAEWAQRSLQNGTSVPELREWRVNAIANYDFTEGKLKGLNAGTGIRWQDEVVIGYPPIPGATPRDLSFDLSKPYMGPTETNVDFWVGYSRRLKHNITWRIQLNLRNAFTDNELIPITSQPNGTPAGYRIAPPRVWTLANTFTF